MLFFFLTLHRVFTFSDNTKVLVYSAHWLWYCLQEYNKIDHTQYYTSLGQRFKLSQVLEKYLPSVFKAQPELPCWIIVVFNPVHKYLFNSIGQLYNFLSDNNIKFI